MTIWTIIGGEPLPLSGWNGRIMRNGIISSMLAERGHDVTWFTSDFSHQQKKRMRPAQCSEFPQERLEICMLHADTLYEKHIGFARLKYLKQLGTAFAKEARKREKPDIIFCALPSIDFAYEAVKYGLENNVPVIIDVRDLWPDIFWQVFPRAMQPIIKLLTAGMRHHVCFIMKHATVITTVAKVGLKWAKSYGRELKAQDQVLYLAYQDETISAEEMKAANEFWDAQDIKKGMNNICFFGNIGTTIDIAPVVQAITLLKGEQYKLIFCGDGDKKAEYQKDTSNFCEVVYPGYITRPQIAALMERSIAGLLPYNKVTFKDMMPNKPIEYMAGGIAVISSLQGELKGILDEHMAGCTYNDGVELADIIRRLIHD
ncbi:MAG: glycosyltransferase, partial [Christensenellaceae bacterium]